jgi:hypothetical protein
MEKFMNKYGIWITSIMGIAALVWLLTGWNTLSTVQKLPILYTAALAVHEIEELRLPGGFVELATSMTGITIKNIGMAKLGLLLFTIYATVVPAFTAIYIWPVMATLLIGFIEIFAHLAAARVNAKRFYSPGLITALLVQFPVAVYGFYYLISNDLIRGIYWIWALVFLLIPLFGLQAIIVKSSGESYGVFVNNARKAMFTAEGRKRMKKNHPA